MHCSFLTLSDFPITSEQHQKIPFYNNDKGMRHPLFSLILILIGSQSLVAQYGNSISNHIQLSFINRASEQMVPFIGEGEIRDGLPVYRFRVALPLTINQSLINLRFSDLSWIPDEDLFITEYPVGPKAPDYHLVSIRKELFLEIELIPYAIINGIASKLESFKYHIEFELQPSSKLKSSSLTEKYAANSVLATGKWVKISISESGIHKIPYASLSGWGFTNPANIRIFGYGGTMLPRENNKPRPDDLPEVAIWHYNNAVYFYGQGTVLWNWDNEKNMFIHQKHDYSDEAYYFVSDIAGTIKTVQLQIAETAESNHITQHFDDLRYHERELNNLLRSGRRWYGEGFSQLEGRTRDFEFPFPTRDVNLPIKISTRVACRDNQITQFDFKINNQLSPTLSLSTPAISFSDNVGFYAHEKEGTHTFTDANRDIKVNIALLNSANTVNGWLDFITINARSNLQIAGQQLQFRDKASHGDGKISHFKITNATAETIIWDITDRNNAGRVVTNLNGSSLEFKTSTTELKEFIAFNPSGQFPTPQRIGLVENQNLHATGNVEYVIVVPKEFMLQANQLAALHNQHSGLSTLVVNPETIYNEFSWGHKDPTAIRSFMKMLYDRSGENASLLPKYLLLFGNGSYDNRTSDANSKSYILTYQSENSNHRTNSYVTDDYFGFLDDSEGSDDRYDRPDIGIGRFPVKSVTEAQTSVDKVKSYLESQSLGKWRKLVTFIGDDEDSNIHMRDANLLAGKVEANHPQFDVRKIFLDNYKKATTSTGKKFPDAEDLINRTIAEGTLIFNYVGHGSENVLAAEQVVNIKGIRNWNNIRNLPVFVTATCEFSRFDNPYLVSAGEETFLNPKGGAIALLSTTRVVYSSLNYTLNNAFFNYVFLHSTNGEKPALGDILRQTKVASGNSINKLNFTLLGDPALKLLYPENKINLVKINNRALNEEPDTLKALSKTSIEGEVVTPEGSLLNTFNGTAEITVYDKPMNVKTLGNDGATPFEFSQYSNILFKGKATVTNGRFTSEFIVPYDIRYNFASGRISLYAYSSDLGEAFGANNKIIVGGFDLTAADDNEGPAVELYLNHTSFKPGDKTGSSPLLYARISDISGINTSGNGIGHDITLIIDGNKEQPIILNSYFQAKTDTYQEGLIIFQLPNLSKGRHEISLKVWDTYNNSTVASTHFVVGDQKELKIRNFISYPNPAFLGGNLWYSFEMDEPNSTLAITVEAINSAGSLTGKSEIQIVASGNYIDPIPLSLPAVGVKSPEIYFLRFIVKTNTGKESHIVQKILVRP